MTEVNRPSGDVSFFGCNVVAMGIIALVIGAFASGDIPDNKEGWNALGALALISGAFIQWRIVKSRRKRRASWVSFLKDTFDDESIVQGIIDGEVWRGQTEEQLIASIGPPDTVDEKALKTKTKHLFKYRVPNSKKLRMVVTFEDGEVVGWDKKDGSG